MLCYSSVVTRKTLTTYSCVHTESRQLPPKLNSLVSLLLAYKSLIGTSCKICYDPDPSLEGRGGGGGGKKEEERVITLNIRKFYFWLSALLRITGLPFAHRYLLAIARLKGAGLVAKVLKLVALAPVMVLVR